MQGIKKMWQGVIFVCLVFLMMPAHALTDMDDNPADLKTLVGNGKWSIVEIWVSDCRICQLTAQNMASFKDAHPDVNIIGISLDGKEGKNAAQNFIEEHQLEFPNLLSHKKEIDQYLFDVAGQGFIGTPTFLFYNPQGKLSAVQARALTDKELGKFIENKGDEVPDDGSC